MLSPVTIAVIIPGARALPRRVCVVIALVWVVAAAGPGLAAASSEPAPHQWTDAELFPRGHAHFSRCWRLEHNYYALREQIAHTGVVWRRQQLEVQWEEVRDARREACLMGW
jgi:hypothetical protein